MKRITAAILLSAMFISAAGCSASSQTTSEEPTVSSSAEEPTSSTVQAATDNAADEADVEWNSILASFKRPAEVFTVNSETGELSDDNVTLTFDDQNRVHTCDYTTTDGLECSAIYRYEDEYAHIYTFGGNYLVDDVVIHCEYSEGSGWTEIDGYYFKNTVGTD